MSKKIGFIGLGNMGYAILSAFITQGALDKKEIAVVSRSEKGRLLAEKEDVVVFSNTKELACFADIIILAVKPKDSLAVIAEIKQELKNKALLSVVAGLNYKTIQQTMDGVNVRVLTALPNTPVQVCQGIIALTKETTFTEEEKKFTQTIFESAGMVEWIEEKFLPVFSAIAGSGPAFAAIFAEALADGAVLEGLPRALSYRLAAQMMTGTGALLLETKNHPGIIKDSVSSPGGTTIEGVAELEKNTFRSALIAAVRASAEKFNRLIH
ncbi:MAG: pyrroline-5-carboxylate reductase [Spirochaetaceae bacterium]|nr:pyrroline-5-carboxylate reductase [Spirochaetaceae bacterium]